jgi:hypothetical protein
MARTSTTGVSYFANPKSGLSIRGPLDNNRLNGRVSNPPRFGMFGGLDVPADKGFKENMFRIAAPGPSIGSDPVAKKSVGESTSRSKRGSTKDVDTNWK